MLRLALDNRHMLRLGPDNLPMLCIETDDRHMERIWPDNLPMLCLEPENLPILRLTVCQPSHVASRA